MPRRWSPYGGTYERLRQAVIASGLDCQLRLKGCTLKATSLDHQPALALHRHVEGTGCCRLVPCCLHCNLAKSGATAADKRRGGDRVIPPPSRVW